MRDDKRFEILQLFQDGQVAGADSTTWYQCPNGHPYSIGNCGQAMMTGTCADCGAPIGGGGHQLRGDNQRANVRDETPTGYALNKKEIASPTAERDLSLVGVALLRVLLHAVALASISTGSAAARTQATASMLAACHQSVTDLPQPNQDGGMEAWLIERLRLSLDALSKSVSRNVDDAATLCHVALNRLLQHESVVVADPAAVAQCWPTAAARRNSSTRCS